MDRKVIRTIVITAIMVALVLGGYLYLGHKNRGNASTQKMEENIVSEMTVAQKLIAQAPYMDYPATPVQLLKYYNEISKCFYNEVISDEELAKLAKIARGLYDEELLAQQTEEEYLEALKKDIINMHGMNIRIFWTEVSPSTDVEYFVHEDRECAKLYNTIEEQSGGMFQTAREVFILRKDDTGHWKIFGFKLMEGEENGGD